MKMADADPEALPFYNPKDNRDDLPPEYEIDVRGTNVAQRLPGETLEQIKDRLP